MQATVLVVAGEEEMRLVLVRGLCRVGYRVAQGDLAAREAGPDEPDLVVLDLNFPDAEGLAAIRSLQQRYPRRPILVALSDGALDGLDQVLALGVAGFLPKPFDLEELRWAVANCLERENLIREVRFLRGEMSRLGGDFELVGNYPAMQAIRGLIGEIASARATVLLQGEHGTGKKVVARALHYHGRRREFPFVGVNLAALPPSLAEIELFGLESGFQGENGREARPGRLELAHRGTLFLEEIASLPVVVQAHLSQVLADGAFIRVGGTKKLPVDVRIIAASSRDLAQAVQAGEFSADLYYLLKVIPVYLPPLRRRKEDIPLLARHFLHRFDPHGRFKGFSAPALEMLTAYNWPGNVRELGNVVERAVLLGHEEFLTERELALPAGAGEPVKEGAGLQRATAGINVRRKKGIHHRGGKEVREPGPLRIGDEDFSLDIRGEQISLEQLERTLIISVLKHFRGNQVRAAEFLGLTRPALVYRMQKHRISGGNNDD
ncbi:MAG: sigma-54 dependent transcriptional regulator [Heliobacteriaceae bacterium]|nr:sigma-54 dependent transcriptional regulator [Heliobacteriaceae bacterium]